MVFWFLKMRGNCLGVPMIRIIVYWGLHWGPPILQHYQINLSRSNKFPCLASNEIIKVQGSGFGSKLSTIARNPHESFCYMSLVSELN